MFNFGSGSEVAPEVPACPVLPGRFPVVPTKPLPVVPGLVPALLPKFVFRYWTLDVFNRKFARK